LQGPVVATTVEAVAITVQRQRRIYVVLLVAASVCAVGTVVLWIVFGFTWPSLFTLVGLCLSGTAAILNYRRLGRRTVRHADAEPPEASQ
jgi:hypothetical protein